MSNSAADEVLAHSQDSDEWEEEAVPVEVRTSGTQVISARLPEDLALQVLEEAAKRGIKPSQLVREALELLLSDGIRSESVNVYSGWKARLWPTLTASYEMESPLVLTLHNQTWIDVPSVVALGYSEIDS